MTVKDMLKQAEMFAGLSDDVLDRIAALAKRETFEEGDKVYELGDDAIDMFVVETGRIRFALGVGNRDSGSVITKGMAFGWAALLESDPRRVATAVCLEDSVVYRIPATPLLDLFAGDTKDGYRVMRRLATIVARDFMSVLAI